MLHCGEPLEAALGAGLEAGLLQVQEPANIKVVLEPNNRVKEIRVITTCEDVVFCTCCFCLRKILSYNIFCLKLNKSLSKNVTTKMCEYSKSAIVL